MSQQNESLASKLLPTLIAIGIVGGFMYWLWLRVNSIPDIKTEESTEKIKNEEMSYCECWKWGKDFEKKKIKAYSGSSDDMKKVEDEEAEWKKSCLEKMNPTTESGKMKMLEEIEKCK
jgi:hypothetical protein